MPDNKRSGSRRQPKLPEKKPPPDNRTGFRPGPSGFCEAQLWEFTGPSKFLGPDEEIPIERVAAASLDQALKYMRRRHYDFVISRAEAVGMIAMLSGSPLG